MTVVLFKFDKKSGSTKKPYSGGYSVEGKLNENTDILAPSISFKAGVSIVNYNYAYIADFKRYYYISRWSYVLGLWRADLSVDTLASWKDDIGSLNAYVLRSASDYDGDIVDSLYPVTPDVGIVEVSTESFFHATDYIVQYTGADGMKSVAISQTAMNTLCSSLWNQWGQVEGMTDVIAAVADPSQYISGVYRTYGDSLNFWKGGHGITTIAFGKIETGAGGRDVTNFDGSADYSLTVPKHPQSGDRPYLKSAPYSIYSLKLPGMGWVQIPSDGLYNASSVNIHFVGESSSGNMRAEIRANGKIIATATGKVCVPWGVSGATSDGFGTLVTSAGATISAGLNWLSKTLGVDFGITDTAGQVAATVTQKGSYSDCVGMEDPLVLQLKYQTAVLYNNADHGRPLMQFRTLGNLSGFTVCEGAHFSGICTEAERDMIDSALNTGFYYE